MSGLITAEHFAGGRSAMDAAAVERIDIFALHFKALPLT